MSLISVPLFRTNNTEKLEAADAYDITDTRPINKLYESAKKGVLGLVEKGGGARTIANNIASIAQMKKAGYTGKDILQASLGMYGSSFEGIIKSTGGAVFDKASAFIDLDPSIVDKIKIGGTFVTDAVISGDLSRLGDIQSLSYLMSDMGLDPDTLEMVNIGVESAIWGANLAGASSLNLYDYYESVKDHTDPDVYYQAVVFSLPTVSTMGAMEGLDAMIGAIGAENILINQPDFISVFLSNFILPATEPVDLKAYGEQLVTKLKLLDPNWYTYNRNGTNILDMKYLTSLSPAAVKVLELHGEIGELIQIAPGFPEIQVGDSLREQFPLMVAE